MVYANIEYLARNGQWRTLESLAFASGELLMAAIGAIKLGEIVWRVSVRH